MQLRRAIPLLLVGLVATACGGTSTEPTGNAEAGPAEIVRAASERVVQDGTSRVSVEVVTSTEGIDVDVSGEGLVDYEAGTAEFTLTLPGTEDEVTLRLLPDVLFLAGLPGTGPEQWVRVDVGAAAAPGGLGQLGAFTDPTAAFQQLNAVADDVTEVGSEQVRGTETTHYRGTVLVQDVLDQAPAEQREALQQQLQPLLDSGLDMLPFDAYIDDEGRLRSLTQTVTLDGDALGGGAPAEPGAPDAQPQGGQVETRTTVEVFDFGVQVDVQEPPPDQVTDAPDGLAGRRGVTRAGLSPT